MYKMLMALFLGVFSIGAMAQQITARMAYVFDSASSKWVEMTTTATAGAVGSAPQAISIYCRSTTNGAIVPCPNNNGSGTVSSGTGIAYFTTPGGTTVGGSGSLTGPVCGNGNGAPTTCSQGQLAYQNPLTVDAEWAWNTGSGTSVPDITGNGHDGTFAASHLPTWGNYGVDFLRTPTAVAPYQAVTTNITTWKSACIAAEPYPDSTASGTTSPVDPAATFPTLFGATANTGVIWFSGRTNGSNTHQAAITPAFFNTASTNQSAAQNGYGGVHVFCAVPGVPDQHYVDGILQPLTVTNGVAANTTTSGVYEFGAGFFGDVNAFKGTILYSTLSIGTSWTALQVLNETKYIQQKIAPRPIPSSGQTSGQRADMLIFPGDSLWAGRQGTGVWTSNLILNNSYTVVNQGVSGKNLHDIDAQAEQTWIPLTSSTGKRYAIFDGASNDLCGNQFTVADTWKSARSLATKAKRLGIIPIYSTVISRTGCDSTIFGSTNAAYDTLVRNDIGSSDFANINEQIGFLDNAERTEFASGGSTNLTIYQNDGTHLTGGTACTSATGYGLFCVGASKVVNTLDGSSSVNPDTTTSNAFVATDANNYVIQTPTASATHQLVDCSWITGYKKTIVNGSASFAITVSTTASQTITGSSTIAAGGPPAVFRVVLTSPTAGGCSWVREQ